MLTFEDIDKYDRGLVDEYYIYDKCETDLEMYNFYGAHLCMDEDEIKESMRHISGADDAYYNALEQAKE